MNKSLEMKLNGLVTDFGHELESIAEEIYDQGHENGYGEGEPSTKDLLEFAVDKFKEMHERGISSAQMLNELESELCTHMPVIGKTLFS